MGTATTLHLAVEVDGDGAHPAAWRASRRRPAAVFDPRALQRVVTRAELAGFSFVTFDDSPLPPSEGLDAAGRLEAGTRAAYVARLTDRIGLAPTLHATTTEPFHLATQLASLDHATGGRAAWVVGAADTPEAMATIGASPLAPAALRAEVRDVVEAARLLWDSWEDGAAIREVATGRFLDPERVHHIDFAGESFSVKGPLITPRPPQGQVVVVAPSHLLDAGLLAAGLSKAGLSKAGLSKAGLSKAEGLSEGEGRDGAAHFAQPLMDAQPLVDIVLVERPDADAAIAYADRLTGPLSFVDIEVVLDSEERAADRLAELDAATPWEDTGRIRHVGSAEGLVELVRSLAGHVDGVRFLPAVAAIDLTEVVDAVLPSLHRAGLLEPPVRGAQLRETLRLPRPANRFASPAIGTNDIGPASIGSDYEEALP